MIKRRRRIHAEPTAYEDIYIHEKPPTIYSGKIFQSSESKIKINKN